MSADHVATRAGVLEILALADDFTAILMFDTLLDRLTGLGLDVSAVSDGFPGTALGVDASELETWIDDPRIAQAPADAGVSVLAARQILVTALSIDALAVLVGDAVNRPVDTKLKAGVSLKIGAIAAALMLVASTGFDVNFNGVSVHKEPLTVDTIDALANLVRSIRGDVPVITTKSEPKKIPDHK